MKEWIDKFFNRRPEAPDEREIRPELFKNPINPSATIGSIVLYGLLVSTTLILVYWYMASMRGGANDMLNLVFLMIWMLVLYPMLPMYKRYMQQHQKIETNSLCAKCRNYEETSLLCRLYDEHVAANYTPCEGNDWQPLPGYSHDQDDEDEVTP